MAVRRCPLESFVRAYAKAIAPNMRGRTSFFGLSAPWLMPSRIAATVAAACASSGKSLWFRYPVSSQYANGPLSDPFVASANSITTFCQSACVRKWMGKCSFCLVVSGNGNPFGYWLKCAGNPRLVGQCRPVLYANLAGINTAVEVSQSLSLLSGEGHE